MYDVLGIDTVAYDTGLGWNTDEDEEFPVYVEAFGRNPAQIGRADDFTFPAFNYVRTRD